MDRKDKPHVVGITQTEEADKVAFRLAMEERAQRQETFVYQHEDKLYRWNVSAAWRLLLEKPRQPEEFYPSEQGVDIHHLLDRYTDLDLDYAQTCDMTLPLLFVPFLGYSQLVDGWHRLCRTLMEEETPGCAALAAYVLTQQEANAILLSVKTIQKSSVI